MAESVLDQNQSDQTQTSTTPTTPTTETTSSWTSSLPEDLRGNQSLGKFKDVGSLAKSYVELEKHAGGSLKLPGADAKPEEWDAFYNKAGRPESPDKYGVKRPQLPEGANWPDATEKNFLETAHKLGLNPKQAQGLMDWFGGDVAQNMQAMQQSFEAGQSKLKEEWGGDWDKNLSSAQRAAKEFIGDDKEARAFFEMTGAAKHPVVLKLFSKLGKMIAEDSAVQGQGNPDAAKSAMEKITAIRGDKAHPYNNVGHPGYKDAVVAVNNLYKEAYPD